MCKDPHALDVFFLLKHVMSGYDVSAQHRTATLASDKGAVAGLSLDMSALLYPDNSCVVGVPQVLGTLHFTSQKRFTVHPGIWKIRIECMLGSFGGVV